MTFFNITSAFARLCVRDPAPVRILGRAISTSTNLNFRITAAVWAEPLKKKKRMDPAIIRAREERRKKKLAKQIRRLEKNARQMKPLEECEIPEAIVNKPKERRRPSPSITDEILEKRILLEKQWAKYKNDQHLSDAKMLDRILQSHQRALQELRNESEELYQAAVQLDSQLLPYKSEGPVETPKIKDYDSVDGDYQDVSRVW